MELGSYSKSFWFRAEASTDRFLGLIPEVTSSSGGIARSSCELFVCFGLGRNGIPKIGLLLILELHQRGESSDLS